MYFFENRWEIQFCEEDLTLGCVPRQFRDFLSIFFIPKILHIKFFGNSRGNSLCDVFLNSSAIRLSHRYIVFIYCCEESLTSVRKSKMKQTSPTTDKRRKRDAMEDSQKNQKW